MMQARDYDKEAKDHPDHKYGYDFDHMMHKFMLRTFRQFKSQGKVLELGCYHGAFTALLEETFKDISVVEASGECIQIAKARVNSNIIFHHSTFETLHLNEKFDVIFLLHTLEHIDQQVDVLKKVKEWLSDGGMLFLATPNANAPSRQIATKMGLISHHAAVTPAEKEHGHTITYTLDTLERDARAAGLHVRHRGGIFFKGLANFQIDQALKAGIITEQYLEGCYDLGMIYPNLCSSIYLVCQLERSL